MTVFCVCIKKTVGIRYDRASAKKRLVEKLTTRYSHDGSYIEKPLKYLQKRPIFRFTITFCMTMSSYSHHDLSLRSIKSMEIDLG